MLEETKLESHLLDELPHLSAIDLTLFSPQKTFANIMAMMRGKLCARDCSQLLALSLISILRDINSRHGSNTLTNPSMRKRNKSSIRVKER